MRLRWTLYVALLTLLAVVTAWARPGSPKPAGKNPITITTVKPKPKPNPKPAASPSPTPQAEFPTDPDPAATPPLEGPTITLEDALNQSLEGNPDILSAKARIEQARWAVENAYVTKKPVVTTYLSYSRTFQPVAQTSGLQQLLNTLIPGIISGSTPSPNSYSGAMVISQTLMTFGRVKWTVIYNKLSEKQAKQDYRAAIETLLQSTEQAYIQALNGIAQVKLYEQRLKNRQEYLRLSTNLFRAGQVAEFDVIQAQSQVESAVQDLQSYISLRDTSRVALLILMGSDPMKYVDLVDTGDPPPPPKTVDEGMARALVRRPELCSLRWSLASAEAQALATAHSNAPSLQWYSQIVADYVPVNPISQNWVAGLQLTIPVYDGGQAYTASKEAIAVAEQIKQNLDSQVRTVRQDVATAFINLQNQWKQIQSARVAATENDETLKIAFNRYQAGVGSGTELLTAQENWAAAYSSLISAETSYRVSLVTWRKAISGEYPIEIPAAYMVDWETPPVVLPPPDGSPDEELADPPRSYPSRTNQ